MLPVDAFRNKITQSIEEDSEKEEFLDPTFLTVGPRAVEYINNITFEGADQVLDEILRDDSTVDNISAEMPNEKTHNRLDKDEYAIFWSKSGVNPFVGVYKKMNTNGNDEQIFSGETTMHEPIKEIDMEALEAHTHFMLKGIDEDTRSRVISDACKDCFATEQAISNIQSIINDDVRLQGYALDEDEVAGLNEYRHSLRSRFLSGSNSDVVDESLYNEGFGIGDNGDEIQAAQDDIIDQQAKTADDELELAKMKSDAANELVNEVEVDLKVDAAAAPYFDAGPESLADRVKALPTGPIGSNSEFEKFVYGINKEGLNALGNSGSTTQNPVAQEPINPVAQEPINPVAQEPIKNSLSSL